MTTIPGGQGMGRGTGRSPRPPAAQSSLPVVSGRSWQDASAKVPGPDLPQAMLPSAPIRNPPRHVSIPVGDGTTVHTCEHS